MSSKEARGRDNVMCRSEGNRKKVGREGENVRKYGMYPVGEGLMLKGRANFIMLHLNKN